MNYEKEPTKLKKKNPAKDGGSLKNMQQFRNRKIKDFKKKFHKTVLSSNKSNDNDISGIKTEQCYLKHQC